MLDYRRAEMVELIADMQAANIEVGRDLAPLTPAQLNWKPNPKEWSVAGCLEHMAITDARYIPQFDALLSEEKRPSLAERLPIIPTLSVRLLLRSLDPVAPMNIKTLPGFYPTADALDPLIVAELERVQTRLIEQMRALQTLDTSKLRVTSPFVSFVTYSVIDACRIIAAHERVHLNQARRVMAVPGYPTNGEPSLLAEDSKTTLQRSDEVE